MWLIRLKLVHDYVIGTVTGDVGCCSPNKLHMTGQPSSNQMTVIMLPDSALQHTHKSRCKLLAVQGPHLKYQDADINMTVAM